MRKFIVTVMLTMVCFTSFGDNQVQEYYSSNEEVQKNIATAIAKRYFPNDLREQKAFEGMVGEAFEKYFKYEKKSTMARDVVSKKELDGLKSYVRQLEDTIKKKDLRIKSLSKEENNKALHDSLKVWNSRIHEMTVAKDLVIRAKSDSLCDFANEMGKLTIENGRLRNEVDALKQSASIVENITSQLEQKQQALNLAYRESINRELQYISDIEGKKEAVKGYREFLMLLKQPVPKEQEKQIKEIEAVCSVVTFYNAGKKLLSEKYNKKATDELLKQYQQLSASMRSIQPMQATELAMIVDALKNESRMIRNFRNAVIGSLEKEGSIPNRNNISEVFEIIDNNISLAVGFDSQKKNIEYPSLYVYINNLLNKLRNGIKNKDLTKEAVFKSFLDNISDELGDPV